MARSRGIDIKTLRDPATLALQDGDWLIVDLNQDHALNAAAEWRRRTGRAVVGFVSHVDTETITAARAAGIDRILARSAFVAQLPNLLTTGWDG